MASQCGPESTSCGRHEAASQTPAPPPPPLLNPEQLAAAHSPLDEALLVLAAAGTGKTTTMKERVRWMLEQDVGAEHVLVLTFSRKAQAEFWHRLRQVEGAGDATVSTFHAWCWQVVRQHWREAGFDHRPTIAAEDQQLAVMRDCLMWEQLARLQASIASWLFLPPSASWPEIVEVAAERHSTLYAKSMQAALAAQDVSTQLALAAATTLPFLQLPPQLQLLLLCELHEALCHRFDRQRAEVEGCSAQQMLAMAGRQAQSCLSWLEAEKRRGRLPDAAAYEALCTSRAAATATSQGGAIQAQFERQKQPVGAAVAFQAEMRRLCLVSLSDLPVLARQLLVAGGDALRWVRQRWTHVLVDEFQDTGSCMLELLVLLMGDRRSVTVVGDDDQSIYSFLDAEPRIFADFQERFQARRLCLQTNFRSTAAICAFGCSLLHGNRRHAPKAMLPARTGACAPVLVRQYCSAEAEAAALAAEVERLWRQEGVRYSSMCALYRCLRQQGTEPHAPLMAALRRRGIPFVIAGRDRLADQPGVAALLSYLALAANPSCDPAFEAVMSLPHHGLGREVCIAVIQQRQAAMLAGQRAPSLLQCAKTLVCSQQAAATQGGANHSSSSSNTGGGGSSQLSQLVSRLNDDDVAELQRLVLLLQQMQAAVGREPLPEAIRWVLHASGLVAWLQQTLMDTDEGQQHQQEEEEAGCGDREGSQWGGEGSSSSRSSSSQAIEQLQLCAPLRNVLQKAQQLAVEWQSMHGGLQQAGAGAGAALAGEGPGDQQAQGQGQGQAAAGGVELIRELLVRLCTESAADSTVTEGAAAAAMQQQQQQQGQEGAGGAGQGRAEEEGEDRQQDPGVLTISTVHAAKGLEWPVVLMPSVVEGLLPVKFRPPPATSALPPLSWQGDGSSGGGGGGGDGGSGGMSAEGAAEARYWDARRAHLEEERRLFHVAATRARDRLLVSFLQPPPPQQQQEPEDQPHDQQLPSQPISFSSDQQPPVCSSILACTLRRLRHRQEVVQFEGKAADLEAYHAHDDSWAEDGLPSSQLGSGSLAGGSSSYNSNVNGSGQHQRAAAAQPSLAQRCQQRPDAQLSLAERCRLAAHKRKLAAGTRPTGAGKRGTAAARGKQPVAAPAGTAAGHAEAGGGEGS